MATASNVCLRTSYIWVSFESQIDNLTVTLHMKYLESCLSLSTIVLNSRDQQGMYGMQHFRASRNPPYNRL